MIKYIFENECHEYTKIENDQLATVIDTYIHAYITLRNLKYK